ncbi:hypothetical protein [Methanomassiliicoccus luminyensis]|uniref:hypothetical protein n=1 Tax=Methanomassiliicoccus luminyensis TaxID=1080712 RepID=UPI0011C74071|nr:hypothetical protein [Methanomassiliicoccus luminyensis]
MARYEWYLQRAMYVPRLFAVTSDDISWLEGKRLILLGEYVYLEFQPAKLLEEMTGRRIICIVPGPSKVREITTEELLQFFKRWDDYRPQDGIEREVMSMNEVDLIKVLYHDDGDPQHRLEMVMEELRRMPR